MSALHQQALSLATQYRQLECDLLKVLEQIQYQREFLNQGYGSLFEYIVKGLQLAESTAYALQTVVRKSEQVPELKTVVKNGELSLGKAKRIAPVLTRANASAWIEMAKNTSAREIDKKVAAENPKVVVEKITPKAEGRSELRLGISDEFENKLKRAQDIVSNQKREPATKEQALEAGLDSLIEKFVPRPRSNLVSIKENLTFTPRTKRLALDRDGHRCRHINERGERCTNQRFLDVHHIKSRSLGGGHDLENLITLCSTHHAQTHRTMRIPTDYHPERVET
jgi:hypothetical protein